MTKEHGQDERLTDIGVTPTNIYTLDHVLHVAPCQSADHDENNTAGLVAGSTVLLSMATGGKWPEFRVDASLLLTKIATAMAARKSCMFVRNQRCNDDPRNVFAGLPMIYEPTGADVVVRYARDNRARFVIVESVDALIAGTLLETAGDRLLTLSRFCRLTNRTLIVATDSAMTSHHVDAEVDVRIELSRVDDGMTPYLRATKNRFGCLGGAPLDRPARVVVPQASPHLAAPTDGLTKGKIRLLRTALRHEVEKILSLIHDCSDVLQFWSRDEGNEAGTREKAARIAAAFAERDDRTGGGS